MNNELDLIYKFEESASGHREDTNIIKLIKDENNKNSIVLSEYTESINLYKNKNKEHEQKYKISIEKLIQLIKDNGTKL